MWQPIETAPDDGSDFVAWFDCEYGKFPHVCKIEYYRGKRWVVSSWAYDSEAPESNYATHWMPLPPPPEK